MELNDGYDRAITVFSPDGRLFQVEYAREAVKRGTTVLGMKTSEGLLMMSDKFISSNLVEYKSIKKIFQIDDHIIIAASGLVADTRVLIDRARIEARINQSVYDESISVETLTGKICDLIQSYTQHGGTRPFGVSLLIGGVDDSGVRLFETDPSGAMMEYKATAMGRGRQAVLEIIEKEYQETINIKDALILGIKAFLNASTDFDPTMIETGIVDLSTRMYRKITSLEVKEMIEK